LLILIDAPHFCAAYARNSDNIAPIIRYMRGWSNERIAEYCRKKGWKMSTLATEAPPSIADELNRKVFETMDWFARKNAAGEVADSAVRIAATALWMATAGLVPESTAELVSEGTRHGGKTRVPVIKVFKDMNGRVHIAIWKPGDKTVRYMVDGTEKLVTKDSAAEARAFLNKMCAAAAKFEELA
jgi:hypothetical protein